MSFDDSISAEADRALTLRICRFLLLSPLFTVPLTLALGMTWLDVSVPVVNRRSGDVVLLHLPGLVNAYPVWWVIRRGRASRLPVAVAVVGLLSYLLPNLVWVLVLGAWRQAPPLEPDSIALVTLAAHSSWYSLILWVLVLTLRSSVPREERRWGDGEP